LGEIAEQGDRISYRFCALQEQFGHSKGKVMVGIAFIEPTE